MYKRQRQNEAERKRLQTEYEKRVRSLDDRERVLNAMLDNAAFTNEENYLAGNLDDQTYARRKFLRDEKEDKYRKEYEESLEKLNRKD